MSESKNTFKKMGRTHSRHSVTTETQTNVITINQYIEYNNFIKTAHFLHGCIEATFGRTHIYTTSDKRKQHDTRMDRRFKN
jgi:hypothetical protein